MLAGNKTLYMSAKIPTGKRRKLDRAKTVPGQVSWLGDTETEQRQLEDTSWEKSNNPSLPERNATGAFTYRIITFENLLPRVLGTSLFPI